VKRYEGFNFNHIQIAFAVLHKLKKEGIDTIDDAINKLQLHMQEVVHEIKSKENQKYYKTHKAKIPDYKCEKCGGPIYLLPVNVSRCTRTGDNSKTAIICYDEKNCGHIEYTKKSINSFPTRWIKAKVNRKGKATFYEETTPDGDMD